MSIDATERARLRCEVVELGEDLFEIALSGQVRQEDEARTEGEAAETSSEVIFTPGEKEAYPAEELREATGVFFRVLRRLLEVEENKGQGA